MKTLTLSLALLFATTGLLAQKFIQEWYIELPGLGTHAAATAILATQDDKLFIAGPSNSSSSIGTMFFMKTDTAGEEISTTFAEEQFNNTAQHASKLLEDKDNNYVMAGRYGPYEGTTYFTKLSPAGDILNTTINGDQTGYEGGYDAGQTADGGYLIASQKRVYGTGVFPALRKLDTEGQLEWDTAFSDYSGRFFAMEKINDSDFVFTGYLDHNPGGVEDLDITLAEVKVTNDSAFLKKMVIFQEDGTNEQGNDILVLPDDQGYVICGTGPDPTNPGYTDGLIMRSDTAGNLIWKKTYTRTLNSNTDFIKVLSDGDDNLLVLARTQGGSSDATLLKYSPEGELLQTKHFDYGLNETAYDIALSREGKIFISVGTLYFSENPKALLLKVKDICPVITPEASLDNEQPVLGEDVIVHVQNTGDAWSYSLLQINGEVTLGTYTGNGGTLDFTAAGLNSEDVSQGLVVSVIEPGVDCIKYSDTLYLDFVDGIEDRYQNSLLIAPNPFQDVVTISDIENNTLSKLTVFNLNGQAVLDETTLSNHQKNNLSRLPKGIYFFRISYREGTVVYRKVVKK